uniref:Uncharacterized protein n=1 Tax=Anguilla anguilla TaxID=7936 RepID=A0A0E9TI76_ANGAN
MKRDTGEIISLCWQRVSVCQDNMVHILIIFYFRA